MTTCENYEVYSHQQIRHEMYDGAGPSSQSEAMMGWHQLAGRLATIRHYLDSAIGGVLTYRQGVAADAAARSLVPLGTWLDEVQRLANDTRDRIDHQITEFLTTRDSIPEIPPEPRGSGWQEYAVIDTFTTSDQEADEAFNAEQLRKARAAMMLYQKSTNERLGGLVRFTPPPVESPDLTIFAGHQSGIERIDARPAGEGGDAGAGAGVERGTPTPPAGLPGGVPGEPSGGIPAPTGAQGGADPLGPEHSAGRSLPAVPPQLATMPPERADMPTGIGPYAHGIGPSRTSRKPADRGRSASSGGVRGGSASGGFSSAAWVPGAGRIGPGGGAVPSGSSEPSGSSDHPTPRGRGMAGPGQLGDPGAAGAVAPFGGSGGRDTECDERRHLSFLLEPDSHRLIGALPPTAPAVIGDDPPNNDEPSRP